MTDPQAYRAAVGRRIRMARVAAGLSQIELAAKVGMTQWHVTATESGRRPLAVDELSRIAEALGVTPSILLPDGNKPAGQAQADAQGVDDFLRFLLELYNRDVGASKSKR